MISLRTGAALLGGALAFRHFRNRFALEDRVAIVTGGSRGLGLELARELLRQGAKVAICARDENELARARNELAGLGEVLALPCDLTKRDEVEHFAREVLTRLGPVDVLINNAGIMQFGPAEEMTLADFDLAMHTHFYGPLWLTWALLPQMRRRREGRIVNISSIGGKIAVPHMLPYAASKFALTGFSEGLREELARDRIKVTTVCPGLMRTGSPVNAEFKGHHKAEYAWFKLSAAVPWLAISSRRAAQRIVRALIRGRAEVMIGRSSLPARIHGLLPAFTQRALTFVNALLPRPGGIGHLSASGANSETPLTRTFGVLSDHAAAENNELRPRPV
jgi:NAD(P)-dependent dehydrogenase (short-subunit alcohol dehydrogenase family)